MSKLNQKNTQNAKPKQTHKTKPKPKIHTRHQELLTCAHHCAQLSYTTQHRTVLTIFPLILQTIIIDRSDDINLEGTRSNIGVPLYALPAGPGRARPPNVLDVHC